MVDVGGKPILERIADHMNKHGIWRIVVNLHTFPEVVMKHFGQRFLYLYEPVPMGEFATTNLVRSMFLNDSAWVMNGDTITNLPLKTDTQTSKRFISKRTGRHMGTTFYGEWGDDTPDDVMVDCEYFDCGTLDKLEIARKHYGT